MFEERNVTLPNLLVRARPETGTQIFSNGGEPGQEAVEHGDQGGSAHWACTCCHASSPSSLHLVLSNSTIATNIRCADALVVQEDRYYMYYCADFDIMCMFV